MSMFVTQSYGGTKEIRKFEHSVCIPYKVSKTTTGVQTDESGRKYIPAGTILPANDATAIGVVLNDTVVEYSGTKGCACALLVHGFVDKTKLPEAPNEAAIPVLTQIKFL